MQWIPKITKKETCILFHVIYCTCSIQGGRTLTSRIRPNNLDDNNNNNSNINNNNNYVEKEKTEEEVSEISHYFFIERSVWKWYNVNTTRLFGMLFSNTLPLWEKEWQYTASSRDELENTPPLAICTPRPSRLPQGAYFTIHPFSWLCIIAIQAHYI